MTSQNVIDRARRLRLEGRLEQINPDETWLVRSDSGQTYAVMIWLADQSAVERRSNKRHVASVRCTCSAGTAQKPCHHALAILAER